MNPPEIASLSDPRPDALGRRQKEGAVEYQLVAQIEGRAVALFEPAAAADDNGARDVALALILRRRDTSEVTIFRDDTMLAVLDRSST